MKLPFAGKTVRAAAAVVLVALGSAAARAETLTDALISAYENSGLLEQNRALLRAADEDVAGAVSALRPVFGYLASVNWNDPVAPGSDNVSKNLALSAEMLLWDFGATQFVIDAAKETVLATREALKGVEQDVLLRAASAYANVLRAEAFVNLRENNVRLITEQLRAERDRFEVGERTRTDVSIVEARLAAARSGLAVEQGELLRAREEFVAAIGRPPGQLQQPPPPPAAASSLAAARAVAVERHPAVRQAQHEVTVAELGILRAEASRYPRLTASGRIGNDLEGNATKSIGIQLSGPIYRGGEISSLARQAAARRDAARAGLLVTTQNVTQNVANAWAELTVALAVLASSDEQVRAARLALRGTQEELSVGARTTLDVLNREQELLLAETERVDALTVRYLAVYRLLSRMGLLTVDHLGLGIPTYDPAAYYNAVKNAPIGPTSPQGERLDRLLRAIGK